VPVPPLDGGRLAERHGEYIKTVVLNSPGGDAVDYPKPTNSAPTASHLRTKGNKTVGHECRLMIRRIQSTFSRANRN
jgi:hypothetical protein